MPHTKTKTKTAEQQTEAAYALFRAYSVSPSGWRGTLHGVMDDGNLEDITLDAYIEDFEAALPVLRALRGLPYERRWEVYQHRRRDAAALYDERSAGRDRINARGDDDGTR